MFHRLDLRGGTDARDRETDGNRRTNALVEQIGFQIDLTVGDRNDVGRNVRRDVAGLRFDDRQRGQGTVTVLLADTRGTFEQTAVQIEHVTGIRFAAGGTLQDERDLAISHGVLGQIIKDDERVHAVIHEPFAHRRAGERSEVLVGGGIGSGAATMIV